MNLSFLLLFLHLWGNMEVSLSQNACSKLPDVPHANIDYKEGDVIGFTCESGYTSAQASKYVCTSDGWLTVSQGKCYSCSTLPDVPHAHVSEETKKSEYQEGDVIHFTCETGYTSSPTIKYVCSSEGWLAVRQGKCSSNGNPCPNPPEVAHAVVDTSDQTEYTSGSKVTYQCRDQYTMEGVGRITCINGQWEEKKFTCSPAPNGNPCPNPPEVAHAVVDTSDQTEYTSGSKVTYQCRDHYTMEGVGRITCINGQWEEEKFTCSPTLQQCERPDEIPNGYFEIVRGTHDFLFGAVIKYYCNEGYHMISKVDTRNCLLGSWSHDLPICAQSCKVTGLPPNIRLSMHGVGDQLTEGQKLRFYCPLRGQTLRGTAEVECLANGQWSHPFPTCLAPFDCGRPPPLDNGDLKESQRNQYRNNERVEYVCQNYHIMDGHPFRTCNNGEWTGQMRCLKPCTVDSEAMNNRNIRFRFSYDNKKYSTHGDEMEFTCARGRPVRTGAMRQLCRDGVIDLPSCQ